jgi:hypothetical protein
MGNRLIWLHNWEEEEYYSQERRYEEWGWEYLRVNPDYQEDYRGLERAGIIEMQENGIFPNYEGQKWQKILQKWSICLIEDPRKEFNPKINRQGSRGVPYWQYHSKNPIEEMDGWKPDQPGDILFKMNTNYPLEWQIKQIKEVFNRTKTLNREFPGSGGERIPDVSKMNHGRLLRVFHAYMSGAKERAMKIIYAGYGSDQEGGDPERQELEWKKDIKIATMLSEKGYRKLFSL